MARTPYSSCRTCKVPIVWLETRSRKSIPVLRKDRNDQDVRSSEVFNRLIHVAHFPDHKEGARPKGSTVLRAHGQAGAHDGRAGLMDPRSLVGMTEGAKKRAARWMAQQVRPDGVLWTIRVLLDGKPPTRENLIAVFADPRAPAWLRPEDPGAAADGLLRQPGLADLLVPPRVLYRVGQRLRPCPWCSGLGCGPGTKWDCRDTIPAVVDRQPDDPPFCDGSGVLPARRRSR